MLRREGFVGPVEPWPERCDIGGVDRRAAPDAKARRCVAIARDVEGGAFLFQQARECLDEIRVCTGNRQADRCLRTAGRIGREARSEEHPSELQSRMSTPYAGFCW